MPDHVVEDRKAAARELHLALWALNRAPSTIDIGHSLFTPALTTWMDVPCPKGMQPAQQLAQTRRFLREHGVDAHAEFCVEAYPRQSLTLPTAADVWRLSSVIVEQLSPPNAARHRLAHAARNIGIEWLSTVRYPTPQFPVIQPDDLSIGAARSLYRALAQHPVSADFDPANHDAVEALLNDLTKAISTAADSAQVLLYRTDEDTIRFSCIPPEAAGQLADALAQHARRLRALLAVGLDFEKAS
ncbi:hypothetical protein ABT071_34785 [Streptomyces sp. NPDC002506]|uniref:hypothetical protein n=1 Tax=Streptomyces sp. NPDC002506 TaxID=3154536 RepID=UPI0033310E46